jgi:predicted alpha/beta-hydrolase family hydrolase
VTAELTIRVPESQGDVTGLLERPRGAHWLLVLAHGAGAGMRHAFLEGLASQLASAGIATLRYQFPYMEKRRGRPDSPTILTATVRAAIAAAAESAPGLGLLAGGKSLGGRMTSHVLAETPPPGTAASIARVRGLVFFGFPLHAPGKPGTKRAEHLKEVKLPMLFLQGTRDPLADLTLMQPLCGQLESFARLHVIDTADHSFHVLKRSGTTDGEALRELARTTASWAASLEA